MTRRWIPVTTITTTAVLWTAYFVYVAFAEGANVGALPHRLEALVRTILTLATLAAMYVGVADRMMKQFRRDLGVTRAETTLVLPRAIGTVYGPASPQTHRRRPRRARPSRNPEPPPNPDAITMYLSDAAQAFDLGRQAERAERDKDVT